MRSRRRATRSSKRAIRPRPSQRCTRDGPASSLSDLRLPEGDGFGVLRAAKELDPELPVIVMTAYGSIQDAVAAMKEGALDFLAKPVDPDHLLLMVERALSQRRLATENILLKEELAARRGAPQIVGEASEAEAGHRGAAARRRDRRHGAARRRERHRQGAVRARRCTRSARGPTARLSPSTARRFRRTCSRPSCSATRRARSPARRSASRASSSSRTAARCFSTKSATCRSRCRPRFCARSRRSASSASAAPCRCRSTCGSSPRPTGT